ncbi:hypothetical protein EJM73_09165 [Clostridium botulinum]|uniref:hypothetical protein n=1 Tax=Clostridium botulinum TaxID=1491 RepID=UPI001375F9B9|nr:hypothetical protein [Clostridium botulinum]NCI19795.1 hypothetical protein [Clostridium botulinum]NCI35833.1 hypothetical protein [Clostridium botulinum]NCI71690.1 hypothetical protein [Clostridium botulinum]NDI38882.1 hypothetical protein [Clostridium botulinum]
MDKIIDLKEKSFEKEINRILKKNHGNGYHRIIGIIQSFRMTKMSDDEILKELKKL